MKVTSAKKTYSHVNTSEAHAHGVGSAEGI